MGLFKATVLVLTALATVSSHGHCPVLDGCFSDGDCEAGLYCFSCPESFEGKKCVRSAATNQFKLVNDSLPFNKYAFLTTHNSFAIEGEPLQAGVPRITFTNQEDTVTKQLNNGVRALMLDTYEFAGDIWLCHSAKGECNPFTAFVLQKMPQGGKDWPLVHEMVASNKRLIVFTSIESKEKSEGIAYQWNYMVENQYGNDGLKMGKCQNRRESQPLDDKSKSLVLVNHFMSIPIKQVSCDQNSEYLIDMLNTCHTAAGNRWANFVAVDYYKISEGGGSFQAVDMLNGKLLCGRDNVHQCVR